MSFEIVQFVLFYSEISLFLHKINIIVQIIQILNLYKCKSEVLKKVIAI